jgi:hypothetical protein
MVASLALELPALEQAAAPKMQTATAVPTAAIKEDGRLIPMFDSLLMIVPPEGLGGWDRIPLEP